MAKGFAHDREQTSYLDARFSVRQQECDGVKFRIFVNSKIELQRLEIDIDA